MFKKDTRQGVWVVRQSARGHTYRVWRRPGLMPQIPQHYLDCSIFLYDSKEAAEKGENLGGSGCLVRVDPHPVWDMNSFKGGRYTKRLLGPPPQIYAVTNKHVVEAGYPVIRLNTIDGRWDVLELEEDEWISHPDGDDLAVAPIDLPAYKHNYFSVPSSMFINQNDVTSEIGAGDDTFMVGRFISHAGKQRNTPSLRFGSIAMLPFEKVKLQDGFMQEAFLVETRSLSGYSGSPVFVYKPTQKTTVIPGYPYSYQSEEIHTTSITDLVGRPTLLGIDCGHVRSFDPVLDAGGNPQQYGWKVESNTGMAIVIPAWRLDALLQTEELVMQRREKNRQYQEEQEANKQSSSVSFDVAKPKPDDFTEDNYMDALKRASRKVSQPESGTKETK